MAEKFGVSPDDASRVHCVNITTFWTHWGQFSSTLNKDDRAELEGTVRAFYSVPSVRHHWNNSPLAKPMLDSRFVEFVEEVISEHHA